jgi:hypothetical protein
LAGQEIVSVLTLLSRWLPVPKNESAVAPQPFVLDWNSLTWVFLTAVSEGERVEIAPGINVWDHPWHGVPDPRTGETRLVAVVEPRYHQTHSFHVYEVRADGRRVVYAADELSNGIFGFFLPKASETALSDNSR